MPISTPFALTQSGSHGVRLVAVNRMAKDGGAHIGQGLRDALALIPTLTAEPVDRLADQQALEGLARWMARLSPLVGVDGSDALILDITGCAHIFGGEASMMTDASYRLKKAGIVPHALSIAGTPLGAAACTRAGLSVAVSTGNTRAGLADLPISALGFGAKTLIVLRRFGLTQIGQLYDIDRKALARRFRSKLTADDVMLRLDSALGLRHAPFKPFDNPPDFSARLNCPDPISTREAIEIGLTHLSETLCTKLSAAGQGGRGFVLRAFRADGGVAQCDIRMALPSRTPSHITRLFAHHLDTMDLGFGADCLILDARKTGPLSATTPAISQELAQSDGDFTAFAQMADRIIARLGAGAVQVFTPKARYLPEHAISATPFDGEIPALPPANGTRPLRLLTRPETVRVLAEVPDGPPQRFIWRRVVHRVVRADGPERINPEWWHFLPTSTPEHIENMPTTPDSAGALLPSALPRARDYYRIENTDGQRFWVFRDGLYDDGRGAPPQWYVQGVFA